MDVEETEATVSFFSGVDYLHFLKTLNDELRPSTYLEIGTNSGESLARVSCDAVCVDPNFVFTGNPAGTRRRTLLHQMGSDDFFRDYNTFDIFPKGIDLAFLDGLHWFEFLLRDFINTESYVHPGSIILLHDCLPVNTRLAERVMRLDPSEDPRTRGGWTGDVWKMLPVLRQYRPDLRVRLIDCPPTGLVAITGLDPKSDILRSSYNAILAEFEHVDLDAFGVGKLHGLFPKVDSRALIGGHQVTSFFSLGLRTF